MSEEDVKPKINADEKLTLRVRSQASNLHMLYLSVLSDQRFDSSMEFKHVLEFSKSLRTSEFEFLLVKK